MMFLIETGVRIRELYDIQIHDVNFTDGINYPQGRR